MGRSQIPGVPGVGGMATEGHARNKWARCKHGVHLVSHNMHSVHGRSCRWLYLSKRALSKRIKFVEGGRRSRDSGSGSSRSRFVYVHTP